MKLWMLSAVLIVAAAGVFAPAKSSSAAEPIAFTIKFPPGQVDHQTMTMDMDQTMSGAQLPAPRKMTMKMVAKTTLKQLKLDSSGSTVEVTYDSMKLKGSMFGDDASDEMDKTLAAFVGQKLTLHFTNEGKVDKVEGVDAILAKMPAGAGQVLVKQFLSDDRVKDQFNAGIGQILPAKPVNVGDTWNTEISHKVSAIDVKIKSEVKLVGIDERDGHKIAKLEFTGKGSFVGGLGAGGAKFNVEQFDQNGTAEFDLTRGWITLQTVDQHMIGSVTVNGPKPVSIKLDQTVRVTSKTTPAKS